MISVYQALVVHPTVAMVPRMDEALGNDVFPHLVSDSAMIGTKHER